jgi:hypothetical protein
MPIPCPADFFGDIFPDKDRNRLPRMKDFQLLEMTLMRATRCAEEFRPWQIRPFQTALSNQPGMGFRLRCRFAARRLLNVMGCSIQIVI